MIQALNVCDAQCNFHYYCNHMLLVLLFKGTRTHPKFPEHFYLNLALRSAFISSAVIGIHYESLCYHAMIFNMPYS